MIMDLWIRNSSVVSTNASISCDQPQAANIGIDILKRGGNAADAAVGAFAAVSVLQPMTCGLGGDCHCLFFRKSDQTVFSINGSGRTGREATLEKVLAAGITDTTQQEFSHHGLWVSVPGAVAGIFNVVNHFGSGKLTMSEILKPAIKLAEGGVPVPYKTALWWKKYHDVFSGSSHAKDLLNLETPPPPGSLLFAPKLATCFKDIASSGVKAFYSGKIAAEIVKEVQSAGGVLSVDDMENHLILSSTSQPSDAIFINFYGLRIWEMKPNTIGIVALVLLNVLKHFNLKDLGHNSSEYIHIVAEATKLAYIECWDYLCDPAYCTASYETLLSDNTAYKIKKQIDVKRAIQTDILTTGGNTSYLAVVDEDGNGCSLICSISSNFGSGLIPEDCGFVLHDRAKSLSLEPSNPNVYGPNKLPLHSIIPAIVTDSESNDLLAVLGVIGRWMQPQGHVQVLLNMVIFGMDPQAALSQPRFFVGNPKTLMKYKNTLSSLCLEDGIDPAVVSILRGKGHDKCEFYSGSNRQLFGRGHVIARPCVWDRTSTASSQNSWWAGADPRSDGCAMGF